MGPPLPRLLAVAAMGLGLEPTVAAGDADAAGH